MPRGIDDYLKQISHDKAEISDDQYRKQIAEFMVLSEEDKIRIFRLIDHDLLITSKQDYRNIPIVYMPEAKQEEQKGESIERREANKLGIWIFKTITIATVMSFGIIFVAGVVIDASKAGESSIRKLWELILIILGIS